MLEACQQRHTFINGDTKLSHLSHMLALASLIQNPPTSTQYTQVTITDKLLHTHFLNNARSCYTGPQLYPSRRLLRANTLMGSLIYSKR